MSTVTKLFGLHPVETYGEDDDTQPSLRGKPIVRQFKVRFSSPMVAPLELPNFAYVPTQITAHEMVFTAIIEATDLDNIRDLIARTFDKPTVIRVEINCNSLTPEDMISGATVRGVITPERRGNWITRLFS